MQNVNICTGGSIACVACCCLNRFRRQRQRPSGLANDLLVKFGNYIIKQFTVFMVFSLFFVTSVQPRGGAVPPLGVLGPAGPNTMCY